MQRRTNRAPGHCTAARCSCRPWKRCTPTRRFQASSATRPMLEPSPPPAPSPPPDAPTPQHSAKAAALILGAIGIVFGDIGTSPLYTIQECLNTDHGVAPRPDNVFGVVSLIIWSVTMVVTVKYLSFMMRADNEGEGGIMALLALVAEKRSRAAA